MQSVGKIPVDVRALGVDLLSLSAHKFNGPKGAGALWIKRGTRLPPILTGGKHERNRRAGTENVPGDRRAGRRRAAGARRSWRPRRRGSRRCAIGSRTAILARVPGTAVNGAREPRVPNTTNISFDGVEAESLLIALDLEGIAVSTGSACSSGTLEPSHVLRAMGLPCAPHAELDPLQPGRGQHRRAGRRRLSRSCPRVVEKLRSLTSRRRGSHGRQLTAMRIVVAMSGGVDSSVAAALLAEAGHDVIGLSMQLYDQRERRGRASAPAARSTICTTRGASPPRIGIPHYIVNFEREFDEHGRLELRARVRRRADADSVRRTATAT